MGTSSRPKSSAERVREFRARQRAQGLKLVQFWVPDVTSEAFKREAHRQSLAVSRGSGEKRDQAFIDSVAAIWQDDDD
ncbi:antitoxin MazE family protein [Mesorhizobium sp. LHD-90]|uniref:antitoxin MazE family protein n=1 Tax=Mesorhizobium sp. LHD-90 TaxID=3071414 RepID=UPI0027DFD1FC|nr:antitoxin MazE family protein [Mesorhizobium sp. LHD-90]MDQ6435916.1 antitoxin MazE family protein [Mesorhizobium sp. LHD-90]